MPDRFSSAEARPFLPLAAGPKNKLRQKVRGGGPKPRESAEDHGQELLRQIESFQRTINTQASGRAQDLPPLPEDVQVIIEAKRLLPEQVTSLGLTPIAERTDGLLVTVSPDVTLPTLATKAQGYVSERTDSGNPRYGGVIAPIEQIRPATRDDKAGDHLSAWLAAGRLAPDEPVWVDVELAGGKTEVGVKNRQEFYDYLRNFGAELPPYAEEVVTATGYHLVEIDYSLHRVLLPARAITDLLDDSRANWILSIELVPEIESRSTPLPDVAGGETPSLPELTDTTPRVVIVDSGIAADHPLFKDGAGRTIIGRQANLLPDSAEPADLTMDEIERGHGTAIASIAAYGSLDEVSRDPEAAEKPAFWLENAKIMLPASRLDPKAANDAPQLHPLQFPKALMREVIETFHRTIPHYCKIFNLSAGTAPHPIDTISNWAEELDNLAAQNDVLFTVAAGDLKPAEITALMSTEGDYPDYLSSPQARLRDPGQAYHALTVGAITSSAPFPPWQRDPSLAPPQHPAPFSRSGLLQPGPVKPDLVEIGGNLHRDALAASPESAILVANRDFVCGQADQPLSFHYGTGLAAARVTHLAGRIQARYPRASANLIRALLVNSAEWPEAYARSFINNPDDPLPKEARQTLLRLCGYGVPQPDKALSSNAHCMVFVAEDEFSWDREDRTSSGRYPAKVSFFSIQLQPDDLYRLPPTTRLRVSVTLAYNPPVRKTQRRRYQAVDLRWDLRRQQESAEEFYARWMAEAEAENAVDEAMEEVAATPLRPWPWELKQILNPGGRVRRGSLIRDWFDIYAHELPSTLELVALGMVAPWRKPPEPLTQRYALVVSIETRDVPIYDAVRVQHDGSMARQ